MADPHGSAHNISPISQLLHTLGLTRGDLVQRSEEMRQRLAEDDTKPLRALPKRLETQDPKPKAGPSRAKPRTTSSSNLARSLSPPSTPVKSEPFEASIPHRQLDTMEMVIERKSKRGRGGDSSAHRRDGRVTTPARLTPSRNDSSQIPPETPRHYRHYSERVVGEVVASQLRAQDVFDDGGYPPDTPSRTRTASRVHFKVPPPLSRTPSARSNNFFSVPSSSRTATPCSSPSRVVNMVSSPGPMRALLPEDEDPADLPYVLPPGPYSHTKPDYSYAAMIGQAVLSSSEHRLTLQDIYDWISTVYPYFRREEQTWMNSVRHALSTMAVFRKVPREHQEGKSLWAILDRDLECFANGGFRKAFCSDMKKGEPAAKPGPKKRRALDDALSRKTKRRKKDADVPQPEGEDANRPMMPLPPMLAGPVMHAFFPHPHQNPHHQPYYQAYFPHPLPAEVIFPPLPLSSNYHRATALYSTSSAIKSTSIDSQFSPASLLRGSSPSVAPSSSASIPDLVLNDNSSSSPPLTSDASLGDDLSDNKSDLEDQWLRLSPSTDSLEPGITLFNNTHSTKVTKSRANSASKQQFTNNTARFSPAVEHELVSDRHVQRPSTPTPSAAYPSTPTPMPSTPPRRSNLTASGNLQLSPIKTPISHRGLHMSPSPSLVHYKSNLDPPPIAMYYPQAPLLSGILPDDNTLALPITTNPDLLRTPTRKRTSHTSGSGGPSSSDRKLTETSPFAPVTPRRLVFPPGSGGTQESPFRTPSRYIFDPHDPGALLDEELSRQEHLGFQESPSADLFGRRGLLYESPVATSPDRWDRFW